MYGAILSEFGHPLLSNFNLTIFLFLAISKIFQNQGYPCQGATAKSPVAPLDSPPHGQHDQMERQAPTLAPN
jgi:hypothetical protein